jgi:hypothetical protein
MTEPSLPAAPVLAASCCTHGRTSRRYSLRAKRAEISGHVHDLERKLTRHIADRDALYHAMEAPVAWLTWYSGAFESSGRKRQDEPWVDS